MIRINLLPQAERRPDIPYARVSAFCLGLLVALLVAVYAAEGLLTWSAERDLAATKVRYQELQPVREAMEQAGDKQKQIDAKLVLLKEVEKTRTSPYNVIPHVTAALTDAVWLDETKIGARGSQVIEIKGATAVYPELAQFVSRLEADELFSSVTVKSTESDPKAKTMTFTIELKLKEM
ncbi:MAG: PilN domain-containing protein [Negativicutes bacterium]|nr:PilN domain-containing protein [Negativicutes bacterium]